MEAAFLLEADRDGVEVAPGWRIEVDLLVGSDLVVEPAVGFAASVQLDAVDDVVRWLSLGERPTMVIATYRVTRGCLSALE